MAGMPRGLESRRTWRPDLAYAVGLITTDGNLSPDGRHITLVSRDLELLETFKHILQLRVRVAHHAGGYSTAYHVVFSDRLFHEWLSSIGLTPRKTHSIGALCIPDDVFPDFARGHLDGDRSITRYVDRYNTKLEPSDVYQRLYTRFLSASRPHRNGSARGWRRCWAYGATWPPIAVPRTACRSTGFTSPRRSRSRSSGGCTTHRTFRA